MPPDLIADQFAYHATGSTTSALIAWIHPITQKLESCTYVRCLLVNYSKVFNTVSHPVRQKNLNLSVPSAVKLFIFWFLTSHSQAVCSSGLLSNWLPVTHIIIQGSGIGPSLYLIYTMDLKTVSSFNKASHMARCVTFAVARIAASAAEHRALARPRLPNTVR